ncbi:hypothetical protein ACHQM5_030029 [Ranunculus cassubicifolius]
MSTLYERLKGIDDQFRTEGRTDWDDSMLCGKQGIRVYAMTNDDIVKLGSPVLKNIMQSSVTKANVGAIILLAWNLRDPADMTQSIFPDYSPCASSEDIDISTLSDKVSGIFNTTSQESLKQGTLIFPASVSKAAACITYVCASFLRLFTKDVNNYLNSLPHITSSFSEFYHFGFPLTWYSPPKQSLEEISFILRGFSIFKYGMAGMLYLHNEIPIALPLRTVLYEQHLSCTGMHAYALFVEIQKALNVTVKDIGNCIPRRPMVLVPFKSMANIIDKFDGEVISDNKKRRTWKYARIFDSSFFTGIQTKNCCCLVYMLAYLSILLGVQDQSVLRIAQIANLGESIKLILQEDAQAIYNSFSADKVATASTKGGRREFNSYRKQP